MKSQTNDKSVSKKCVAQIPFGEDIVWKSVQISWRSTPRIPPPATLVHGEVPMMLAPRKLNNCGFEFATSINEIDLVEHISDLNLLQPSSAACVKIVYCKKRDNLQFTDHEYSSMASIVKLFVFNAFVLVSHLDGHDPGQFATGCLHLGSQESSSEAQGFTGAR